MDAGELEARGLYDPAAHLGSDRVQRLGHRSVAGFDDPVEVYALTR